MALSKKAIFDNINRQLLEHLRSGTLPWRKSWKVGLPKNITTSKVYGGINFLNLSMNNFASPNYLTFLQCQQRGGKILKGERGSWVIYWSTREIEENDGEVKTVPIMKRSIVFNLTQTDLYKPEDTTDREIIHCEQIIQNMQDPPIIMNNSMRCYYSPLLDYISIPSITEFETPEEYYSSLFHEIIHWTGHSSRLNRLKPNRIEEKYSFEELIAEIGSSYLCAMCNIAPKTIENSAAYINGWLSLAKGDKHVFLKAALESQKAVNWILNSKPAQLQVRKCS